MENNERLIWGKGTFPSTISGEVLVIEGDIFKKDLDVKCTHILVLKIPRPDIVILLKKSAGFIAESGGLTCHAALISRELGIPGIVGARDATTILKNKMNITMCIDEKGVGYAYKI